MESYKVKINGIDVNASYSERAVKEIFLPLLQRLTNSMEADMVLTLDDKGEYHLK